MAGNTFGQLFRIATFGESHGPAVGAVIDGCPPCLDISDADIQKELDRRKPGQSNISTPRKEQDLVHILSGTFEGRTTGTPILLMVNNISARSSDYNDLCDVYRPGHADYTYQAKYGVRDWRGGGRASARETIGRVAAGAIAKKYLWENLGVEFIAYVEQVGDVRIDVDIEKVTSEAIESNAVRCPDSAVAAKMVSLIESVRDDGDSIGGLVRGAIRNVPSGLGEPVFDKLHADLGKAMLSINAAKGFEIGSGFACVGLRGSEQNDEFYVDGDGKVRTRTNRAGGTLGGISNGETISFRVAFKAPPTIRQQQRTVTNAGVETVLKAAGRHDPCVAPRAVPIVEAMAALVIMDHFLRQKAQNGPVPTRGLYKNS